MVVRKFIKPFYHRIRRLLAKKYLARMSARQIALTGSQGKTNTTYVLSKILTSQGKVVKTDTNLDTIYNVPITALKVRPWHKFAIFELGVDHPGEMDLHLQIVKPEIAIITGISPVHTDNEHFGSLDKLITEKSKLIEALPSSGYAILNYDDQYVRKMAKNTKAHVLWYGTNPNKCTVWADSIQPDMKGLKAVLHDGSRSLSVSTTLIGEQHIYTLMAAYLVSKIFEIPTIKFIKKIKEIKPLKGRMSIEPGINETVILNDSLRSNPSSMRFGLKTLNNLPNKKGKTIAILADMGELENPEEEHRQIGKFLSELHIDHIFCIGKYQLYTYKEALKNGIDKNSIDWFSNVFEAADTVKDVMKKGNLVYLKGSLYKRVDRIFGLIKGIKPKCNVKGCPLYNPSFMCHPAKCTIPNHIHHDDTHE